MGGVFFKKMSFDYKAYWKEYKSKNGDKIRAHQRNYYRAKYQVPEHRQRTKERSAEYYLQNKERLNKSKIQTRFKTLMKFNFTCQYCGRKAPEVILHIDHIVPKSKGGRGTMDNLTVACFECNMGKSDILLQSRT